MPMRRALAAAALVVATACGPAGATPPLASATSTGSPSATRTTDRPGPARAPLLGDEVVQGGLEVPWDIAFAPDGRMFVTQRPGSVTIFESGAANARRLGEFRVPDVRAQGESGLMGVALDPAFASNGLLYLCASRTDEGAWRNQVLRLRVSGNSIALDGFVIRTGMLANTVHDGCRIRFGPDGKLWVTMGEAGRSQLAQDPASLNGKILRVNADGSIPADNPTLPGQPRPTAVWSYGHRNPQGIAFQPGTGRVFEVEHGAATQDEINVIDRGRNYGWPNAEGPDPQRRYADPAWSSGDVTYATSGAAFLVGPQWGTWAGSLAVVTLKEQDLRRFAVDGERVREAETLFDEKYGRLRAAVLGPDGALYLTTSNRDGRGSPRAGDDRIIRLAARQP